MVWKIEGVNFDFSNTIVSLRFTYIATGLFFFFWTVFFLRKIKKDNHLQITQINIKSPV